MKRLILLLALSASACSQSVDFVDIDPVLRPYHTEFIRLFAEAYPGLDPISVGIQFTELTDETAQCRIQGRSQVIYVDRSDWDGLCEAQRRAVIFHELGHCALYRDHSPNIMSYMYERVLSCDFYERNQTELDRELFALP